MSIATDLPRVKQLTLADFADILDLQRAVIADLPAGFIRPRADGDLRAHLDGTLGVAYGIREGAALVAMSLLRLPDGNLPKETLHATIESAGIVVAAGLRERMSEEDWARSTCFVENAIVHPAARGRGYQRALVGALLGHAAAAKMRWVCSGAHLRNSVSWRNLLASGLAIVVLRFDPQHPILGFICGLGASAVRTDSSDQVVIAAHEPSQHQAALQDGYVGVRIAASGAVVYERLFPAEARSRVRTRHTGRERRRHPRVPRAPADSGPRRDA